MEFVSPFSTVPLCSASLDFLAIFDQLPEGPKYALSQEQCKHKPPNIKFASLDIFSGTFFLKQLNLGKWVAKIISASISKEITRDLADSKWPNK